MLASSTALHTDNASTLISSIISSPNSSRLSRCRNYSSVFNRQSPSTAATTMFTRNKSFLRTNPRTARLQYVSVEAYHFHRRNAAKWYHSDARYSWFSSVGPLWRRNENYPENFEHETRLEEVNSRMESVSDSHFDPGCVDVSSL